MPHRTELIRTPSGLQAALNMRNAHAALDSLTSVCDQYQQRYHDLPHTVMLADTLPETYKWLLRKWCEQRKVVWAAHFGATEWVLIQTPEGT